MASACSVAIATSEPKLIGTDFLRTPAVGNCVLVTIALVCTCFLVVCGVLIVREYSLASSYAETRCQLVRTNNTYHHRWVNCMFCAGLRDKSKDKAAAAPACVPSQFPCVKLFVHFAHPLDKVGEGTGSGGGGGGGTGDDESRGLARHVRQREAVMHPDSLQATGPFSECSFSICLRNKEDSEKAVNAYVAEWRSKKGSEFTCYYDTISLDTVIVQKMYTTSDVVHSMLWPSLVVLACGAIFLRMEMRRRRLTLCGSAAGTLDGPADHSTDILHDTRYATATHLSGRLVVPNSLTAAGGGGGIGTFSATGDGVGRKMAAARAGRPAVVYQSLPSLIHLQVTDEDDPTLYDRLAGRGNDVDERYQAGRGPVSPAGVPAMTHQRQHHHHHNHHHNHQYNQYNPNQNHQLKQTLVRKLSASMDQFEKTGAIGGSGVSDVAFNVRETESRDAADIGCNGATSGLVPDGRTTSGPRTAGDDDSPSCGDQSDKNKVD